jgi:hypothetical protein
MKVQHEEILQRLGFIDRTIIHAMRACHSDGSVPDKLKDCVEQLGLHSSEAQRALQSRDEHGVRQTVDALTRISHHAQNHIHQADGTNYDVRSAVILTHIELSALRYQLD